MEREFDISCGVDVGKWSHHFTAIDRRTGEVLLDAKIGQDEREIRDALGELTRVFDRVKVDILACQNFTLWQRTS